VIDDGEICIAGVVLEDDDEEDTGCGVE
jgi:hypothetical protein